MQVTLLVDDGSRLLGTVVVALHEVGTLGTNLTIDDAHVHGRKREAHTVGHQVTGTGEGYHGSSLCHAVAFQQLKTQRLEAQSYLAVEGGSTTHQVLYVSTHLLVYGTEDQTREAEAVDAGAELEEVASHETGIDLLHDARVERLPQTGDTHHDGYLATLQRGHDVGTRHGGADGHTTATVYGHHHGAYQGQDVVQG